MKRNGFEISKAPWMDHTIGGFTWNVECHIECVQAKKTQDSCQTCLHELVESSLGLQNWAHHSVLADETQPHHSPEKKNHPPATT